MIQGDLDGVEGKTRAEIVQKSKVILDQYFGTTSSTPTKGRFADPAAIFTGK